MSKLTDELTEWCDCKKSAAPPGCLYCQAADRIEDLEEALREIAEGRIGSDLAAGKHVDTITAARICGIARTALTLETKGEDHVG